MYAKQINKHPTIIALATGAGTPYKRSGAAQPHPRPPVHVRSSFMKIRSPDPHLIEIRQADCRYWCRGGRIKAHSSSLQNVITCRAHTVTTRTHDGSLVVAMTTTARSLGDEHCDVIVTSDRAKVSHHAKITLSPPPHPDASAALHCHYTSCMNGPQPITVRMAIIIIIETRSFCRFVGTKRNALLFGIVRN